VGFSIGVVLVGELAGGSVVVIVVLQLVRPDIKTKIYGSNQRLPFIALLLQLIHIDLEKRRMSDIFCSWPKK
jgi:hypothetical protein